MFKRECVIEWDDVRDTFLHIANGGSHPQAAIRQTVRECKDGERLDFYGCKLEEMRDWLENGFVSPELSDASSQVKEIQQSEIIYDEEGENVDVAAALSGDDEPFYEPEDRPLKPGIRMVVELAFLAQMPARCLAEYGAWVAAILANFEGEGIDVELDVEMPSERNLIENDPDSSNTMFVRVKRAGEIREYADYSALFSPGGFRLLGFTTRAMACQEWGVKCSVGYGISTRGAWDVLWEPQGRVLRITRESRASSFPRESMQSKLESVLD